MARCPATLAWGAGYTSLCKRGTSWDAHTLRTRDLSYRTRTENYNLNGRRPFSRVRLSSRFHLNISFLCAIEIPRPFFHWRAPRSSVTRYTVVTPRNFFAPASRSRRFDTPSGVTLFDRVLTRTRRSWWVGTIAHAYRRLANSSTFKTPCVMRISCRIRYERYVASLGIASRRVASRRVASRRVALRCGCDALRCVALRCVALRCVASRRVSSSTCAYPVRFQPARHPARTLRRPESWFKIDLCKLALHEQLTIPCRPARV